jgi:carboxypeptidase C (cathepsin A)
MTYTLLAEEVASKWGWGSGRGNGPRATASVSDDIRQLLSVNPSFRLMIAHGYSDLVTPYAVNKYVINHLPSTGVQDRVKFKVYRGGHMFYTARPSRIEFTADVKVFYAAQSKRP